MAPYNLNFWKYIRTLLPFQLRSDMTELLFAWIRPIRTLHSKFLNFRNAEAKALSYNAQYTALQRMLNDRFDKTQRRIRVREGSSTVNGPFVYPNADNRPAMLGTLLLFKSSQWGYAPFEVRIPQTLYSDTDKLARIKRLVDIYKFSGTQYIVNPY
ncbi:MAG: hypothetical protein J6W84_02010 [Bacteroidales bacterium]|nr:hypothetical protein [Bacteroidales bacterium]